MDTTGFIQIAVLIALILLSAFFSSAETALTTANQIRIGTLADDGNKRAACLLSIFEQREKMLSAVLIGNNIVNLSASALATAFTIRQFGSYAVGFATGILTLVVLVFGEIAPKTRAMIRAEKIALSDAYFIRALMTVLTPVIFLTNKLARLIVRITGIDPDEKPESMTEDELLSIVDESHKDGVIENEEREMIGNLIDFGDTDAIDIMIPWVDVTSAEVDATYDDIIALFNTHRYTRIPIYEETQDNILGILNCKDLLLTNREEFDVRKLLYEPYFTLEHKKISSLLEEMRENSLQQVIVIDEYGSTSGIITLEDVLEEIVGEITDEYKGRDAQEITTLSEGREYSCLGSISLDDFNEELDLELESEEYETLGGYIIEHSEDKIPAVGEYVTTEDGVTLIVEAVNRNRITRVHVYLPDESGPKDLDQNN